MSKRHTLFLRDVLVYTFLAFGGPQAHLAYLLREFVEKRRYVSEEELMELNALSQILPGPSSTQTLVGIAWKTGGLRLALLAFFIWVIPSAAIMCIAAIGYKMFVEKGMFTHAFRFIQPVTVGIVACAAYTFGRKFLKSELSILLSVSAMAATLILRSAYAFPILIMLGGIISSAFEAKPEEDALRVKLFANINQRKVIYFIGILLFFAVLGAVVNQTSPYSLPIRLFENFYRNGILIFGGGQVLVPLMFTEFVEMKHYLSNPEFLSGYALQQILPGPTFAFTSFIGGLTLGNRGYGVSGQIAGSFISMLGINLPGLILILFIVPFWDDLKKISRIRNSLSGINAVAVGFMVAAFLFLAKPFSTNVLGIGLMAGTFLLLQFTPIKTPFVILVALLLSVVF
ncbi:chromate efflux transporter [uncultured Mucilaginibacter sp.]|uniref:chromate efflux transporter n=1 Tax=uncultured Mucilaginibacter sp. TaxID=797541 RepID=UPI0026194F1D|nr:chromate efflux transporter [uncultured Mucilaginibacter sp.]